MYKVKCVNPNTPYQYQIKSDIQHIINLLNVDKSSFVNIEYYVIVKNLLKTF